MCPRVVYWNDIPSPYMVERFNAMARLGNVEFEAWFNERTQPHRSWRVSESSWLFRHRYLPQRRSPVGRIFDPRPALKDFRPDVMISLFSTPSFMWGWTVARRMGVKTAFRLQAPSPTWHPRRRSRELAKRYMFRRADALFVAGPDSRRYALSYGVPESRVMREANWGDLDFFRDEADAHRGERSRIQNELGLVGTVFVYVGRLWWGKGVEYMLEAFATVERSVTASLVLVGNGADEERLKATARELGLRNVVFAGFRQRDELPPLLAASDVFVLPTLGDPYAHVIDEAMAVGLPVISTSTVGDLADRLRDGVTGMLVPARDSAAMAEKMLELAGDPVRRDRLGQAGRSSAQGRGPALWVQDVESAVARLLSGDPEHMGAPAKPDARRPSETVG